MEAFKQREGTWATSGIQIKPPPGVTADPEHPKDDGHALAIGILTTCMGLMTMFFCIRMYVRLRITKRMLSEDYCCIAAYVVTMVYCSGFSVMIHYGLGYHSWDLYQEDYAGVLKWLYFSTVLYCPACYLVKTTLLLLTARVFAVRRAVSKALHIYIIGLFIAYIPIQLIKTFVCNPISAFWEPEYPTGEYCLNQRKVFIADICVAIVTDLVVLLVPLPLICSMNLELRKKLKIICLLCAGGVAVATTCYRLYAVVLYQDSNDEPADFTPLALLTVCELTIGFLCACLPSLNLLIERHFHGEQRPQNRPRTHRFTPIIASGESPPKKRGRLTSLSDTAITFAPRGSAEDLPWGDRVDTSGDFDVELAMATGKPLTVKRVDSAGRSGWPWTGASASQGDLVVVEGRTGMPPLHVSGSWMEPRIGRGDETETKDDAEGILKTVEISTETSGHEKLGSTDPLTPPSCIWDGVRRKSKDWLPKPKRDVMASQP